MKKFREEWEKTLFWAMVAVLMGTLMYWTLHHSEAGASSGDVKPRTRRSFLGENPYAFLEGAPLERIPSNPFSYGYTPEVKRPWRRPAETAPATQPPRSAPVVPKPAVAAPPTAAAQPTTPRTPAPPPPARVLGYRGFLQGGSGTQVAFVKVTDPATKKSSSIRLEVGRKIDGIEVKGFSGEALEVVDPNGKSLRIARGSQKKIVLE